MLEQVEYRFKVLLRRDCNIFYLNLESEDLTIKNLEIANIQISSKLKRTLRSLFQ